MNALKDAELSKAASEVFQRIKEAGENLQDPGQAAQYDEILKAGVYYE